MNQFLRCALAPALASVFMGCTASGPMDTGGSPTAPPPSSVVNPSVPTPSPKPSPSAEQKAAVSVVMGFSQVSKEIGAHPSRFSEAEMAKRFRSYLGGDMMAANVKSFMELKRNGYRWARGMKVASATVSDVSDHRNALGLEIRVTLCQDQTQMRLVDKDGATVIGRTVPAFNVRLYTVRKPAKASKWRVYAMSTISASATKPQECGS